MNKINKYIGGLLSLTLLLGCSNFEKLNTNPDTITEASASMVCTGVILDNLGFGGDDWSFIAQNALSKYVGYANEGQMDYQYNLLGNGSFDGMTMLPNVEKMLEYAKGSVMENSYKGIAKFSRAYMFYHLTMEMGDIPYTETNQGASGNYTPVYDTQESVLIGVLDELKEAAAYFASGETFSGDPTPFNGDPDKWRRATNAFALKVLMSLSHKSGVASLDIVNRFKEIVSENYLLESEDDYLGLEFTTQNQHPLYGTNDLFTSRTVLSSLVVDNLKSLNDRRMYYFADPAGAQLIAGYEENDPDAYVGVDVSIAYETMNQGHSASLYSLLNDRYLELYNSEPRRLMTYAEQELILAEARILGWITTSTAADYYETGVKAALYAIMVEDGNYAHGMAITQNYIDNYFTGEAEFKSSSDDQLKQIWLQRYLLNFMQNCESSYFEYRRNTYPEFPINPATSLNANNVNAIPMRWLYPGSETEYNRENLINALDQQYDGYDEINKLMWVLK